MESDELRCLGIKIFSNLNFASKKNQGKFELTTVNY